MAISVSCEGGVGLITMESPPANAYDKPMLGELAAAVQEVRDDDAVRCVVVRSALDKFFCAGADISVLRDSDMPVFHDFLTVAHEAVDMIERTPKLFIAAIRGHCIGGGLELALGCDLRLAAEGGYGFGLAEVKLGLSPGMGGTQRLARLIPKSKALDLMVTGDTIRPEQALELGVIDRLFPAQSFDEEVMEYANRLAAGPSLAQGLIKLSVNQGLEASLAQGLSIERANQTILFGSQDAQEGVKAFLDKRKAEFKGK